MQSTPCHRRRDYQTNMKGVIVILQWGAYATLLTGLLVAAIEVREPENENEGEGAGVAISSAALTATEPTDNGMAVGEAPEIESTAETDVSPEVDGSGRSRLPSTESEFIFPSADPTVDAVFPENHKNFSGSTYLGAIESPPYLSSYNKYQQQYKEYYAQKSQYMAAAKPIKFENDNSDNRYVSNGNGLSAYGDESSSQSDINLRSKPFPYVYEALNSEHTTQTGYPIPEHNGLDPTSEEAEENEEEKHKHAQVPGLSSAPFFPSFSGLSSLFGGRKVPLPPQHHDHGHLQSQRSEASHKHKSTGSWKKILKVLSTVVPFGLFLATLTPNLLYINSTEDNRPSRLRSLDNLDQAESRKDSIVDPLVELVQRFGGLEAMEDPQCEDRFFCEMSILGKKEDSNFIEKGFWYLANETPDNVAQEVGMKQLFHAIRSNSCETYNCPPVPRGEKEKQIQKVQENEVVRGTKKEEKKQKKFKKFSRI